MTDTPQSVADARLEAALETSGARDPREFYRTQLKELRGENAAAYEKAVAHYRDRLIPSIVDGADPLQAWTEYGRTLAELRAPGRTVIIDTTGRSTAWASPAPHDALILHLPEEKRVKALVVGIPPELTSAQRATYDWLVTGKLKLRDAE